MRVLHGPVNVGNQPWVLSRHERALGVESDLVISYSTWLKYQADRCLAVSVKRTLGDLLRRACFGMTAPFQYEVLHLYFGRSFLSFEDVTRPLPGRYLDLRIARWMGRKIFMTLQGCDVRLSDESDRNNEITMCRPGRCSAVENCRTTYDAQRRRVIARVLPLCDRVFALNPELVRFVPNAVFMPYASVDVEALTPRWPRAEGPIKILHAPSDPGLKGTHSILQALDRLKKRWPIEVVLVQKLPHAEALALYATADLVIDQALAGWYGGFAVEAMALGKPVACYLREQDLGCLPPGMRRALPLIQVRPESLERDLETALSRRSEWPEWGRRARQFALRWHNPRTIARAMVRAYRDPQSRFHFDPDESLDTVVRHDKEPQPCAA